MNTDPVIKPYLQIATAIKQSTSSAQKVVYSVVYIYLIKSL